MKFVSPYQRFTATLIFQLLLLGQSKGLSNSSKNWYQGCHVKNSPYIERPFLTETSLPVCASKCRKEGFQFVAISMFSCTCVNEGSSYQSVAEKLCDNRCKDVEESGLRCGGQSNGTFSIYSSSGPYIESIQPLTQQVESNIPVILKVMLQFNKFVNILKEPLITSEWKNSVELVWQTTFTQVVVRISPQSSQELAVCTLTFPGSGNFHIVLSVRNIVSSMKTNFTVHVLPQRDSQKPIEFFDPVRNLSCPFHFHNMRDIVVIQGNVLVCNVVKPSISTASVYRDNLLGAALLVNTSIVLKAAAVGRSLSLYTSTWKENTWKPLLGKVGEQTKDCKRNLNCTISKTFRAHKNGLFTINAKVNHADGSKERNFTLVVLNDRDIFVKIETESNIVPTHKAISFNVSVVSARIHSTTLVKLQFGDGVNQTVTVPDKPTQASSTSGAFINSFVNGCSIASPVLEHVYKSEGIFHPTVYFENTLSTLKFNFPWPVTVLNLLSSLKLDFPFVCPVNVSVHIRVTKIASANISAIWTVTDQLDSIYLTQTTAVGYIDLVFTDIGRYDIAVTVSNQLSSQSAWSYITILDPIGQVTLECSEGQYISVEQEFSCNAAVDKGSDVEFYWNFQDGSRTNYARITNQSSIAKHKYIYPGSFNVSVLAKNNISSVLQILNYTIHVNFPLRCLYLNISSPIVGHPVKITAVALDSTDVKFDLDFGLGAALIPHDIILYGNKTTFSAVWTFSLSGNYTLTASAYNQVSKLSRSLLVYVQDPLPDFTIHILPTPLPTFKTLVLKNSSGHTLNREDLLYTFHFYDEEIRTTRVPVVSMEVKLARFSQTSGVKFWPNCLEDKNNIVQVIVFNQAGHACKRLALVDNESNAERSEGQRQEKRINRKNRRKPTLWHSTFVRSNEYTSFLLENKSQDSPSLLVNYGYGSPSSVSCFNDSCSWDRKFHVPGVFALDVSIYGRRPNRNDQTLRSVLVVEEPIKGLRLLGPSIVGIECEASWVAEFYSGSHVVYVWSVNSVAELPSTSHKLMKSFSKVGLHTVHVNVSNEVSSLKAIATVQVKFPIVHVSLSVPPTILGHETNITISLQGGSDFIITCDFGDGKQQTVASKSLTPQELFKNDSYTSRNQVPISVVHLSHRFIHLGVYSVSVNVSNGISSLKRVELAYIEEPIGSVNLYTKSLQLSLTDELEVTAVVSSGKNLKFYWDFSDGYSNPIVFNEGYTSTAKHLFGIPDKYKICVSVSNNLQPKGIKVCLPQSVDVIDKITKASIEAYVDLEKTNAVSLVNKSGHYATKKVVFKARSDGSSVQFHFDFGDGESTKIDGKEDNPIIRLMVAKAEHVYTKAQSYSVKLTAFNDLGNLTVTLAEPFYVQIPPTSFSWTVNKFCFKVGEKIVANASVDSGTDVSFLWKFDNIPEILLTGNSIVHQFDRLGSGNIFVTASNKVGNLHLHGKYSVVPQLTGLILSVNTNITAVGQEVVYHAKVLPDSAKQNILYHWSFYYNDSAKFTPHLRNPFSVETRMEKYNFTYSTSGRYYIIVKAENCLSSVESNPVAMLVVSQLNHLTISMTGDAIVNSSIRFKAEYWQGDFLNFTWDFGDGSFINSTLTSEVIHNYSVIGEYTVQLEAKNPVSSGRCITKIFILNQPCNPPSVEILGNKHTHTNSSRDPIEIQLKFLRSEPVRLEAKTRTNCSLSTRIKFNWQLMEMENKVVNFNFHRQDYKDMKYFEYPMLYLPPRSLKIGEYLIKLKVKMSGTVIPVYSEVETKIYIGPTPLVSSIFGGAYRHVAHYDTIHLDGRQSYSPDNASTLLRYAWSCETFNMKPYNCTETFIEKNVSLNSSLLVFPASWLNISLSTEFLFKLKVSFFDGDDASAVSDQVIKIHPPNKKITDIYLDCPQCWRNTVNPDRKISIRAHCPKCHNSQVNYRWKIFRFTETKDKPLIDNPSGECVDLTDLHFHQPKLVIISTTPETNATINTNRSLENESNPVTNATINTIRSLENETRHSLKLQTSPILKSEEKPELKTKQQAQSEVKKGNPETPGDIPIDVPEGQSQYTRQPLWPLGRADQTTPNNNRAIKPDMDLLSHLVPTTPLTPTHMVSRENLPIGIRSEDTFTGLDQPSLVLKPGLLKQGVAYRIDLSVTSVDGSTGMAMIYFKVNQSPMRGKCSRRAQKGFFRFFCSGWQDEHRPLLYEISYSMRKQSHAVNEPLVIYLGLRHSIDVRIPKINQQPGPLNIAVINRLGAKTFVCNSSISTEVQPTQDATENQPDVQADVVRNESLALLQMSSESVLDETSHDLLGPLIQIAVRLNELSLIRQHSTEVRMNILKSLGDIPKRDEAEVLQALSCLVELTEDPMGLNGAGLLTATTQLKESIHQTESIMNSTNISGNTRGLNPHILKLAFGVVSNLLSAISVQNSADMEHAVPQSILKSIIEDNQKAINKLLQLELQYHSKGEVPLVVKDGIIAINASQYSTSYLQPLIVEGTIFQLPPSFRNILHSSLATSGYKTDVNTSFLSEGYRKDADCFQTRAISFSTNHLAVLSRNNEMIDSDLASLEIYTCSGEDPVHVHSLPKDDTIHITIPRKGNPIQNKSAFSYYLDKSMVNIHQINASLPQCNFEINEDDQTGFPLPYLQLHIRFDTVLQGRSFPVTIIISSQRPPYNLKNHVFKKQFDPDIEDIKIPIPKGFYKGSQNYFISLLESSLNSGRRHSNEIKGRHYTLNVWWGNCVYWNQTETRWRSSDCQVLPESSIEALHCSCTHLSTFGGYFEIIPNDLTSAFVEEFFNLHENPVVIILVVLVFLVYILLLFIVRPADQRDVKKGSYVYLQDNTSTHQQKYEIILETGLCREAGTTARISMILHGEEGMSETRELISDDNRPMFERNSRDRFIVTLPSSLGKIFKIQLWHNNAGSSPGWFLQQVIVRDLSAGQAYYFLCHRWLAVDREDGKVEREFTALDENNITFSKIFWCKGIQYISDFHTWLSVWTCPAHSRFTRVQRVTVCFTLLLSYMCLNALWFQQSPPKIRGEFGLLDLSSHNIIVGAVCCVIMIPLNLLLNFLFRRSKVLYIDYEEDKVVVNGKSICDFSNDGEDEPQQPAVTYSILDQSILNWQNIQDWAQKQWLKRQQSVMSNPDSEKTTQTNHQVSGHPAAPVVQQTLLAEEETDQASSGFEDATSQATAERHKIKATSEISSDGQKSKNVEHCDMLTASRRLFLPFWCRYVAWLLCILISCTCATFTILYGFRFGHTKSAMWIQSVYLSFIICLFIAQPFLVLLTVLYTAVCHQHNPSVLDHYDDGFYGEKTMSSSLSKQLNRLPEPEEELLRGVAERSRSRYLRFAGPPQEKKLKSSRKKLIKQRRAMDLIRDLWSFIFMFVLLMIIAFGKDLSAPYKLNTALKHLIASQHSANSSSFMTLRSQLSWYSWSQTVFLETLHKHVSFGSELPNTEEKLLYSIGNVQLGQIKDCLIDRVDTSNEDTIVEIKHMKDAVITTKRNHHSNPGFWGQLEWYDNINHLVILNNSREEALQQLQMLEMENWIDIHTQAIFVEMTLYHVATNLFSSVTLLLEVHPAGLVFTSTYIRSTYLFRYITLWDNCILGSELLYIFVTFWILSQQLKHFIQRKRNYFYQFWNYLELTMSTASTLYVVFYIYRFILVSEAVEMMRSSFYEQFISLQFLTLWDELIQSLVGLVMFCVIIKILQILRYHQIFWRFQSIYRRCKNELLLAAMLYFGLIMAFSSLSTSLFGATVYSLRSLWSSMYTMSTMSVRVARWPHLQVVGVSPCLDIVLFFSFTMIHGFIMTYIFVILTHRFKKTKNCHVLAMPASQMISFYWEKLKWFGSHPEATHTDQTDSTLPPEFTMAEILYLVEELLFRMNALLGISGLPDKRSSFTDSDSDQSGADDGISSGAASEEHILPVTTSIIQEESRLEHRVQKIEDKLCSNEPYLAQLLKLDSIGTDILSEEKEKELRSHLEFEIFRQLQLQRQELSMFNVQPNSHLACPVIQPSLPAARYSGLLNLGACSVPHDSSPCTDNTALMVRPQKIKDAHLVPTKAISESYSSQQEFVPEEFKMIQEVGLHHHQKPHLFLPPKRTQSLKVPGKQASPYDRSQKHWADWSVHTDNGESHLKAKLQRVSSGSLIQKHPHIKPCDKKEIIANHSSLDKKFRGIALDKELKKTVKEGDATNILLEKDGRRHEPNQNLNLLTNTQNPSSGNVSPQSSESERGHKRTDSSSGQSGQERNDPSRIINKRPELPPKPTFALRTSDSMKSHSGWSPKSKQFSYTSDLITPVCHESSSGSEQEATLSIKRAPLGRRNLRKTKSRGKGKGNEGGISPPPLVLDPGFASGGETSNFDIIIHPVPSGINPNDNLMPEELL